MKMFKIILCFFIILFLVACGNSEFMNLYSFTENYNRISNSNLSISDFYFQNPESPSFTAILGDYGNEVLLTLENENTDIIEKVSVSLAKEKNKTPTNEQLERYKEILRNVLATYCCYDKDSVEDIISAFSLNNNKTFEQIGELTLKKDNFYFVYYSNEIISQVIIYNTYLHKIEPTEKPVSKPYYAEDFIVKEKETP